MYNSTTLVLKSKVLLMYRVRGAKLLNEETKELDVYETEFA